ncbi:Hypothetical protein LUCI_4287 [Lucifera butyrica]|uniref:Porin domain-containing protein n=1 Tax=Lucifera butyrica TaxID=1351585 RepID=A0A498RC86_9FIRM|nr:hypothetical protein [Lucifera butyrica]VBB09001.1 Hypothetical protein LUCI_4287 [Lucifera butyrica]
MKKRVIALTVAVLTVSTFALAAPAPFISGSNYTWQNLQTPDLSQLNKDLSNNFLHPAPDLELNEKKTHLIIGQQNYELSRGLIAEIYGVCGVRTILKDHDKSASFFYGNDGEDIVAADFKTSFPQHKDLSLDAVFFQTANQFMGLSASSSLASKALVSIETSENLTTQAKGYLITAKYGDDTYPGGADLTLLYRYVEPGAVSDYSAFTDFDDSRGVRIQASYRFNDNLSITAYQDFARSLDNSIINRNSATLSWSF